MKAKSSILALGVLLGVAPLGNATIVGFGQLGGNNTQIPADLASSASADGNGFVVTNGATPNISLIWDPLWDIHTSSQFAVLEGLTVGGNAWDNEGNMPRIAQFEEPIHTITFEVDPGFALVLNTFDFGHTGETPGTTTWAVTLSNSSSAIVWEQFVSFTNRAEFTLGPNFTGQVGEDYTLQFSRSSQSYNSAGRHGIDNLSFNQVPEPSTAGLLGIAALGLLSRRRSRTQSVA